MDFFSFLKFFVTHFVTHFFEFLAEGDFLLQALKAFRNAPGKTAMGREYMNNRKGDHQQHSCITVTFVPQDASRGIASVLFYQIYSEMK